MYLRYNKTILSQKSTNKFIDRFNWKVFWQRILLLGIIDISPADFLDCQLVRMYKAR